MNRIRMHWLKMAVREGGLVGIVAWMDWHRGGWQAAGCKVTVKGIDVGARRQRCRGL